MENSIHDSMASRCNSESIWLKTEIPRHLMGMFHVEFQQNM
jgi:hypothetical protein